MSNNNQGVPEAHLIGFMNRRKKGYCLFFKDNNGNELNNICILNKKSVYKNDDTYSIMTDNPTDNINITLRIGEYRSNGNIIDIKGHIIIGSQKYNVTNVDDNMDRSQINDLFKTLNSLIADDQTGGRRRRTHHKKRKGRKANKSRKSRR